MRPTGLIAARRSMMMGQPTPFYHDGIHLDFRDDRAAAHYVKAINGAVTLGALTTLFSFTGDNKSYYMGPAGVLIPSVTNTPRIEYTQAGQVLGLKMEQTRANLALYSCDGTNAVWTKSNCTAAMTATGPDGVASSATTLTATAGNATCLQSITSASATRAAAVWLKRRTGTGNIDMTVDNGTTWTTKTITTTWTRYYIVQASVTNPIIGLRIVTSGDEVDFWNEQIETASISTSDVPTTSAQVTRASETCARTLGTEFSATAGTVVARFVSPYATDAALNAFLFNFDDGTSNERIGVLRLANQSNYRLNVTDGGVNQAAIDKNFATASARATLAVAWAANDFASALNGSSVSTDSAGTLPTVTTLLLGYQATPTNWFNGGHLTTFDYYPTRLPNNFLVTA